MNLITKANHYFTVSVSIIALAVFLFMTHMDLIPQIINIKNLAAIIFLMLVIYAAFRDGFFAGLVSTLAAEAYFLYIYATPGHPFHYTQENIWRLIVIGTTLSALAYLISNLRQRINNNIAKEKTAREKAEKTVQEFKKSDFQKEQFLSIASHELKTPITSLRLFTHLLKKKAETEKDSQTRLYIQKIDNQVSNLTTLTMNLLDASRITTGKLTLRKDLFSINDLLKEKIDEIAVINETHKIIKKGGTKKKILADRNYIGQVLINLLTNAVRYSPEKSKIIVRIEEADKAIKISVQDFGQGIAKEHQKKIFEQFYQIGGRRANRGLGIGLYITSQIIKQHKGKLSVKSKLGEGSTFTISLPFG